jgi:hypothetical protein
VQLTNANKQGNCKNQTLKELQATSQAGEHACILSGPHLFQAYISTAVYSSTMGKNSKGSEEGHKPEALILHTDRQSTADALQQVVATPAISRQSSPAQLSVWPAWYHHNSHKT